MVMSENWLFGSGICWVVELEKGASEVYVRYYEVRMSWLLGREGRRKRSFRAISGVGSYRWRVYFL